MDEGAAFGFFPQLRPRRRLQDPTASADVPLQVLRGRLAGLLGLPSDIGNIVRTPQPMEAFGSYEYEQPQQLPYTTEQFLKELPLAPTAPIGQLAGQAASFVPLNPAPLVRGAQKLGTMVGEGMAERVATGRPMLPSLLAEPQSAMFAVEPNVPRMNLLDTPPETMTSLLEVKPQAAVSDLGFYSAAEQAALNLQRNKGTGQAFLNDLLKAENVKKDELQWMGVDDFLKEKPNVTKQEVQDFIANNRVDVQEVRLGGMPFEDPIGIAQRKAVFDKYEPEIQDLYRRIDKPEYVVYDPETNKVLKSYTNYDDALLDNLNPLGAFGKTRTGLRPKENSRQLQQQITEIQNLRDAEANAAYVIPEAVPTKYQRYQLPGGENYREILMTLPQKPQPLPEGFNVDAYSVNGVTKYGVYDASGQRYGSGATKDEALQKFSEVHQDKPYKSSHFDEPNILAHIRVNDRVDADGKKMLLIEEIQSDWHQAGRERGYRKEGDKKALELESKAISDERKNLVAELVEQEKQNGFVSIEGQRRWDAFKEKEELLKQKNKEFSSQAPDAPFKDTWYQLALKRILKHAADNGYERVGLTTGKQQADRFNLAKQVDHIDYRRSPDGTFELGIADINGDAVNLPKARYAAEELPSLVGKEVADKIVKGEGQSGGGRMTLRGLDLQVGGEGMKKYYDEIYPKFLDKYGKKWNARVGETYINTGKVQSKDELAAQVYGRGETYKNLPSEQKRKIDVMFRDMGRDESIRYIDITPEMKGAVSKGQPLFAATPALPLGAQGLLGEPEKKKELSLLD